MFRIAFTLVRYSATIGTRNREPILSRRNTWRHDRGDRGGPDAPRANRDGENRVKGDALRVPGESGAEIDDPAVAVLRGYVNRVIGWERARRRRRYRWRTARLVQCQCEARHGRDV